MFTVTTGEYSDYYVEGVFRSQKEIPVEELRDRWISEHPEQRELHRFRERDFLTWVFRQGYFETVPSWEWHLSEYRNVEGMIVGDCDVWNEETGT